MDLCRRIISLAPLFSRTIIIHLLISLSLLVFLIEISPSQAWVACQMIILSKREIIPPRSLKQRVSCSRAQEHRIIIVSYSHSGRKLLIVYSRKQEVHMASKVLRNSAPVSSRQRITIHSTRITAEQAQAYSSLKRKVHILQVHQPGGSRQLLHLVYSRARQEAWARLVSPPLLYSSLRLRSGLRIQCIRKKKVGIHFSQHQLLLHIQGLILYNKGLVRGIK